MLGRDTPGKARDRHVRTSPEDVHRAALADKTPAELLEHAVALHEHLPEARGVITIVRTMDLVLIERDRIDDLVWPARDADRPTELLWFEEHPLIESRHRLWLERNRDKAPIARFDNQAMVDEVKDDFESLTPVGDQRRGQPACGDVKGGVPGVVDGWRVPEPDFADDLQPEVQG